MRLLVYHSPVQHVIQEHKGSSGRRVQTVDKTFTNCVLSLRLSVVTVWRLFLRNTNRYICLWKNDIRVMNLRSRPRCSHCVRHSGMRVTEILDHS